MQCRRIHPGNSAEEYYNPEPNQMSSQDASVSSTIYPAFLAITVAAPLNLGKGFVGKKLVKTLYELGVNVMATDPKLVPKSAYTASIFDVEHFRAE